MSRSESDPELPFLSHPLGTKKVPSVAPVPPVAPSTVEPVAPVPIVDPVAPPA